VKTSKFTETNRGHSEYINGVSRWIDNIKMDLLEIGVNVLDWIGLAQDRYRWRALVNSVMNLRVP
jgi:hypothetical protein